MKSELHILNFINQTNELYWTVDSDFKMTFANAAYKAKIKALSKKNMQEGDSVLVQEFGENYVTKWHQLYTRVLSGETIDVKEHFANPEPQETDFFRIKLSPVKDDKGNITAVACHSNNASSVIADNEAERLLDASMDVICQIDENGIFTQISKACKELWGYEKHELVGKPYISFVIEEDIEKTNEAAAEILLGKTVTTFENRYRKKDGSIASNLWSVRYDQNTKNLYCVARDAREKIRKEESLLQSEQRFKALVQEGADMISIIDVSGNYIYTSPTTTDILGIAPEEFDGNSIFDFIHPDDLKRATGYMQRILTENKVIVEPFRLRNGNNEWRWIETVLTNRIKNPAIKGIVANSRDITDKKNETQHLKLLESVITNTNDAVLITEAEPFDEPGPRIMYVNEAFTRMTGYTAEDVIGKTPRILQGPKSDKAELARLSKAIRNWEPCEINTINYKKNGEEFWINFSLTPVADDTGWYTHWIAIERDVTEKKNQEVAADLSNTISTIFNEELDLSGALHKLCETVTIKGFFSFCEIWLTDTQENLLELKIAHQGNEAANIFYKNSKRTSIFKKGEGVPGKVWETGNPVIWEKTGENRELLVRSVAAEKAGIKAVAGFPLIHHDKFIGVLQFGTTSSLKTIEWIINVLSEFGLFIGSEIARKKTEIEFKTIFEFAPDIIATCGFDGYFKTINPYTTDLLGYSEKEFTSRPFTDFLHPDDVEITTAELQNLAVGKSIKNFKNRYITKTGDIKTISWNCSPAPKDGLIFCIGKDITEEVKIENLLKDANQMSRIGGWEVDMINQELQWSDIVYEIHEVDKNSKVSLETALQFYRGDYQELVRSQIDYCLTTGLPVDFEAQIVTANNNEVWVRAMGRAELVNGQCTRIYGSFQDITQKKIAEISMKSLSNNLPGTMFQYQLFADGTEKLLNLTKGAEKLWGIRIEEGLKNNTLIWDQIIAGGDVNKVRASISQSMQSLEDWHVHFRSKLPNGKIKWLEGLGTPRRLSDGSTIWDSIILDITHLKETEQLLDSASKLARVGSWELILQDNEEFKMFWSSMTKRIIEIDDSFEPTLADGINFHKEPSRALIVAAVNKAIETGETFDLELELVTEKEKDIWVRCIGNTELENGKVTRIFGSYQDINTRKLAELNHLQLIEEKNNILESIGDAFFAVNKDWKVTYWNHKAELVLGKNREKIVGKHLWEEFEDAIDTVFYKKYHAAFETMETENFEAFYETTNQWLEVTAYPSKDGLSVYFKDVTAKKEYAIKIQEANERFEKVAEATADAIWDWDIVNDKFYRGNGFADLYGDELDNLLNTPKFQELSFHEEDYARVKTSVESTLLNPEETQWESQYRIKHTSGKTKSVLDKGIIIRNSSGKATRMIGAIKDISYIIEHEEELLKLNKILKKKLKELEIAYEELEQFAYIASHDLQEPLRMVSSFMEQLKRKYGEQIDDRGHQYIEFAIDGAKRMKQIILDLLEYSRAGRIQEELQLIDLNKIIEEFKILRRNVIAEKKVVLETANFPQLKTFKTPVIQVFHNLIDNAIKYARNNTQPKIKITFQEKKDHWQFCVEDNGIGIDEKYFKKVFILFQRLHNRDQYEGTGIGLAVVKKSVESIGGHIWIESKVNKGSKFYFTIPK